MNLRTCFYVLLFPSLMSCRNSTNSNTARQREIEVVKPEESFASYEVLRTEPYETSYKAQIKSYVYLTTDTISREKLSATLMRHYSVLDDYHNFKNFSSPTAIAIYLFANKDKALNTPGSWIAMLSKTPSDDQPQISFDDRQLGAVEGLTDGEESEDEKFFAYLSNYLKERNTDLCFIYKTLYDLEGATIKLADIKYPDFGIKHSEYQDKLYKDGKRKLFKKYRINDTFSAYITAFGMSYCK